MILSLSLSMSHFAGLVAYTFFHGQVAGSEQKNAPLPHRKCIEHPCHSPAGRSGCLAPLCLELEVVEFVDALSEEGAELELEF